jgi:hypothetical protein
MLSQPPIPEAPPSAAAQLGAMAAELRAKAAALSARPGPGPMARARLLLALAALVEAIARMILRWQEGQETPAGQPRPARASTPFPADRAATWSRSSRPSVRSPDSGPTTSTHPQSATPQTHARAPAAPARKPSHPRGEGLGEGSAQTAPPQSRPAPSQRRRHPVRAAPARVTAIHPPRVFKNPKRAGCKPTPFSFREQVVSEI